MTQLTQLSLRVAPMLVLLLGSVTARADETVVTAPAAGTPEAVVAAALEAGLAGDFAAYLKLVHPEERATPTQRSDRERYEWKRFAKQAAWYVRQAKPMTFVVTRREVDEDGKEARLFIKDLTKKDRMPVPIRMRKDARQGWGITVSSL